MGKPELIGRARELALVSKALDQAATGHARTLIVRGQVGIGKTALIDAVIERESERFQVIRLSGHPAEIDLPYAGVHHLLHAAQKGRGSQVIVSFESGPLNIAIELLTLIASLAEQRPLLLVVDDAQWLDRPSRQALVFAVRRLEAEPVCVLLGARSSHSAFEDEVVGLGEVINLPPLSREDSTWLLHLVAPHASAFVAARVVEHAAGVPLTLIEAPKVLTSGQLAGVDPLPVDLPVEVTIERMFGGRFTQLVERERIALLALCFDPLDRDDWPAVLDELGCSTSDLDAAERVGLLDLAEGQPVFRHPSVPAALRQVARTTELSVVHNVLAQHFSNDPLRRITHLQRTDRVPRVELRDALVAAAEAAEARQAFAEAAQFWEQAARLQTDEVPAQSREYLVRAVEACVRAGASVTAERLLRELTASTNDDTERAALAAERAFVSMWSQAVLPDDADELLELGLRLTANDDPAQGAAREAGRALVTALAITTVGAAQYRKAHDICRRFAKVVTEPLVIDELLIADVAAVMVGAEGAGAVLRSGWVESYPWQRLATGLTPIPFVALTLELLREYDILDAVMTQHMRQSEAFGRTAGDIYLRRAMSAIVARSRGRWDIASSEFEALERFVVETDAVGPYPFVALQHALLLSSMGHPERSNAVRAEARSRTPVWTQMMEHLDRFVEGHSFLINREFAAAAQSFAEVRRIEQANGLAASAYLTAIPDAIETAWHLGTAKEFIEELERYESVAQAVEHAEMLALAVRCRALLAAGEGTSEDEADRLFDEAIRSLVAEANANGAEVSDGAPIFEEARTRLLWGQVLRRARRKSDAMVQLEHAEQVFIELGAAPLLQTCTSELAACGRRRAASATQLGNPAAKLTPREYEVAREVASGATNAQAAVRLFISERTVEFHLSRVFRKLHLTGRDELADLLHA